MSDSFEIRLRGTASPDGQVRARDLAALAESLQELRLRIGRDLIDSAGPGRTKQYMEELAELRLTGISAGSTILAFAQGPTDKLEALLEEERQLERRFHDIVVAISEDQRPPWVTDLIAESAAKLVSALRSSASEVEFRAGDGAMVLIQTGRTHAETWQGLRTRRTGEVMSATGRLERVDLHSREFRIRDDVGHTVDLRHVGDADTSGPLVGRWVIARGLAVVDRSGDLIGLDEADIAAVDDPAEPFLSGRPTSLQAILAAVPGPDPEGAIELSDEEFEAFLRAARS